MHGRWPDVLPFLQYLYSGGCFRQGAACHHACHTVARLALGGDFDLGYGWG